MWAVLLPSVAPEGEDRVTITVSLASTIASSMMEAMVMVSEVESALKVKVPSARV